MLPRKIALCLVVLLLCSNRQLTALELTRDDLKLVLHEGIGRFSLYIRGQKEGSDYTPLFVAQDPRTSVMSVIVGDRLYKLGESREFKETLQTTAGGARFCWVSDDLSISEDFTFVSGGVSVRIALRNVSGRELTVGLRFCLDTYLGEKGSNHFSTSGHAVVDRELEIQKAEMVRYWKSSTPGKEGGISLYSHTSGEGVTVPDRIIFANWKRISDTSWKYEISPSRNFNLMPYSINDSAVCQYYSPRLIQPDEVWTIGLLFSSVDSAAAPSGAAVSVPSPQTAKTVQADPLSETAPGPYKDLLAINSLIEEINRLMLQESLDAEEIERLRAVLAALKSKTSAYIGSD
jgi:hypothetical protein